MRLVYKESGAEVKVGDSATTSKGEEVTVQYFRQPSSPASEGKVSVLYPGSKTASEFYVSVIGAEWIEREDRPDEEEEVDFDDNIDRNPPKSPEKGLNFSVVQREEFEFEAVHDSDNDWVLYSPDIESCEGNSREQMQQVVDVANQAPAMLRALRQLRSTAYDYLDEATLKLLGKLDHIE